MNLFKQLYEGTQDLIKSIRLPFVEKSIKRAIESAKDNALQKINEIELDRFNVLKDGIENGTLKPDVIAKIIEKEVEKEDQNKVIQACDKLYQDLFGENMPE